MEFIVVIVFAVGWVLGLAMLAAVVTDLAKAATRRRGLLVLVGGVAIAAGPVAFDLSRQSHGASSAIFLFSFTVGFALLFMYAAVLLVSAVKRLLHPSP
jgi:hypothetical protein